MKKKYYRIEIFGFFGEKKDNFVHLYGLDHLSIAQVIKEAKKINSEGYAYQIATHKYGDK